MVELAHAASVHFDTKGYLDPTSSVVSDGDQRALEVILPQGTKSETALKAVRTAAMRWLENLDWNLHLKAITTPQVKGPFPCPWLFNKGVSVYGEDMYLVVARFRSTRPREVRTNTLMGQREIVRDVGAERQSSRPTNALPNDAGDQLAFVANNQSEVYRDLLDTDKKRGDSDATEERFGYR